MEADGAREGSGAGRTDGGARGGRGRRTRAPGVRLVLGKKLELAVRFERGNNTVSDRGKGLRRGWTKTLLWPGSDLGTGGGSFRQHGRKTVETDEERPASLQGEADAAGGAEG